MPSDITEMIPLAHYLAEIGSTTYAERLYRRVTELDGRNEEAWLGRARAAPSGRDAVAPIQRYLEINPDSAQAKTALNVAQARLKARPQPPPQINPENEQARALSGAADQSGENASTPARKRRLPRWLVPVLLILAALAVVLVKLIFLG
jgi:hypothetical protein